MADHDRSLQGNATAFRWSAKKERAAVLLAEDDLGDDEIAAEVGVNPSTLWRWKQHPDFAARVGDHVGRLQAAMLRYRVAKKRKRLAVLDDLHDRAMRVIEERAARYGGIAVAPGIVVEAEARNAAAEEAAKRARAAFEVGEGEDAPGMGTGILVRDVKVLGQGKGQRIATTWAVDTPLLREIRAIEEQAARELGQWVEKSEVEGQTTTVRIVGVDAGAI